MTSARPAPPPAPSVRAAALVCVVALGLAAVAAAWLLWPGRAPAHPYSTPRPHQVELVSRSFDRGPGDGTAVVGPASAVESPSATPLPPDSAEQAAVAAAALAGSDAAEITAEGFALTSVAPDPAPGSAALPPAPASAAVAVAVPSVDAPAQLVVPEAPLADSLGPVSTTQPVSALQADAHARMLGFGFGEEQWGCLDSLIDRESGWHVAATNIRSGAYGLPQALPATKMASAGTDWRTNPDTQLRWMLGYVQRRYDDPCGAWAHETSAGWY